MNPKIAQTKKKTCWIVSKHSRHKFVADANKHTPRNSLGLIKKRRQKLKRVEIFWIFDLAPFNTSRRLWNCFSGETLGEGMDLIIAITCSRLPSSPSFLPSPCHGAIYKIKIIISAVAKTWNETWSLIVIAITRLTRCLLFSYLKSIRFNRSLYCLVLCARGWVHVFSREFQVSRFYWGDRRQSLKESFSL